MVFGDRRTGQQPVVQEENRRREDSQEPRTSPSRRALAGMNYEEGAAALSARTKAPVLEKGRMRTAGDVNVVSRTVKKYRKTESQAEDLATPTWGRLADFTGIHIDILQAFNPGVAMTPLAKAENGEVFYEPSAPEILFWQTAMTLDPSVTGAQVRDDPDGVANRVPQATTTYETLVEQGRLSVIAAARDRTAGETGDAYARFSGAFYTPNDKLAARLKWTEIDGKSERRAAWGDVWKCNVFVNDALHQAGLKTPMLENRHYATAGMMYQHHTDKTGKGKGAKRTYEEVGYDKARAGDIFVRYGGTGEASSHTEVITAKVDATTFYATGAHGEGAYERRYITDDEAFQKAKEQLVRDHLRADGKEPEAMGDDEFQGQVHSLGWELADAAHVQQMNVSSYHFLRHKQVGK